MLDYYPTIEYENVSLKDISVYYTFIPNVFKRFSNAYTWYVIKDWISPENLAYNFYGSCDYVWAIFAANNIVNPVEDWILSPAELEEYIKNKYGADVYNIKYYEYNGIKYTNKKFIPIEDTSFKGTDFYKVVTNYDYEMMRNDAKRKVKIIKPVFIDELRDALSIKLKESYVQDNRYQ